MTEIKNREWITEKLTAVPFVTWDRFVVDEWNGEQSVSIYGWIDRDDAHTDFVNVIFWPATEVIYFVSSSAARDDEINRALYGDDTDVANECQRVEHEFDIENVVTINE